MRSAKIVLVALACSLALGCKNKQPEPTSEAKPPEPPAAAPAEAEAAPPAATTRASKVTWPDPPGWRRVKPTNAMRKASYVVPKVGVDTEDAELTVFNFGAMQGGDVEANMKRWTEQFKDASPAERSTRAAGGMKQEVIEIKEGTYASGMPGQAKMEDKAKYGLLGAIVETPEGRYFFKLTGPKNTVQAAKPAFFELLDNVRYEK